MAAHAELGPSTADRSLVCTASVARIRDLKSAGYIPERSDTIFTTEGTAWHQLREDSLLTGLDPYDFIGQTIRVGEYAFEITIEICEKLQPGIDWLREVLDHIDVEIKVRLDAWMPGQFGTMDSGGIAGDTLIVCDLKAGAGVSVSVIQNRQLMLYALGYWHHLGRPQVKNVLLVIDQPRSGGMKFWSLPLADLIAFGKLVSQTFLKITTGDVVYAPTEKGCRFCPVRATEVGCPAYDEWMLEVFTQAFDMDDDFEDLIGEPIFVEASSISPRQRAYIVKHADLARAWLQGVQRVSLNLALEGNPDPGLKAVDGAEGNRYFSDPDKAAEILVGAVGIDAFSEPKLIGITDAEKLLKPGRRKAGHPDAWEALQEIVSRKPGRPVLVSATDPRPEVTTADQFDDLDELSDQFEDL